MVQDEIIVWIVEDQDMYSYAVSELLAITDGMRCSKIFIDCESVIQHLRQDTVDEYPDVILLDINLGRRKMLGTKAVAYIKPIIPTTNIVMVTMREDDKSVFDALRNGASGYLVKGASTERIISAIQEANRGGVPMTRRIARKMLQVFRTEVTASDYGLTKRETQVLQFLVDGKRLKDISESLAVSNSTIDSHIRNVYAKLHVHSRARAVVKAVKEGLIST